MKSHVDEALPAKRREHIRAALVPLRTALMRETIGLSDQAQAIVDIHYLAKQDRRPEMAMAACTALRDALTARLGHKPDIRAITLEPEICGALG